MLNEVNLSSRPISQYDGVNTSNINKKPTYIILCRQIELNYQASIVILLSFHDEAKRNQYNFTNIEQNVPYTIITIYHAFTPISAALDPAIT